MATTKRINVNKNDEPALVAEKVIDAEADSIVLNIPKFSQFAASAVNFKLIRRQAELLKKTIVIESVDEAVLSLAKKSGLEAINPFFSRSGQKQVTDIVVKGKSTRAKKEMPRPAPIVTNEEEEQTPSSAAGPAVVESLLPKHLREEDGDEQKVVRAKSKKSARAPFRFPVRRVGVIGVVLAVIALTGYLGLVVLPKAEIKVQVEKKAWAFNDELTVDKALAAVDGVKPQLPGQLFVQKNNATLKFPATGTKAIERKAAGKMTIYNAYSSESQQLVANTRFQTADGKVFRLAKAITIPGAQIKDGKIAPSSIEADIVADKPGAEYNIDTIPKLTIPGFAGTPKFNGFYGEIKTPTTGGFVGEAKIATEADITKAKSEATRTLESSIRTLLASQIPADFKVLDGSSKFTITKQTIDDIGDSEGNFSVFTEGEVAVIAFKEADVLTLLINRVEAEEEFDYQVKHEQLTYEVVDADDPHSGKMLVEVNYRAQLSRVIDQKSLLQNVRGQTEEGLKGIIAVIEGVEGAEVSFWPVWVRKVPQSLEKIELIVE